MEQVNEYLDGYNTNKPVVDSELKGWKKFQRNVTKFLWWCAGADQQILLRCPMTDRVKYAGIGGLVFCTGFLAFLSGSFAFYTIFGPKDDAIADKTLTTEFAILSLVFGLVWGIIVLNMDRFIISSTGKGIKGSDRSQITGWELLNGIPRILIALVLGFAISSPLEVRILKTEVDAELQNKQDAYLEELNASTEKNIALKMKSKKEELNKVEDEITEIDSGFEKRRLEIQEQRRLLELEAEGKTGSGVAGRGPAYRDKKENLDKMELELNENKAAKEPALNSLKERREKFQSQIDAIEKSRDEKYLINEKKSHSLDGLMERIHISHEIGGWIPWIILMVFLSIEMGPIFFKMMVSKGVYEYLLENQKKRFLAKSGIVFEQGAVDVGGAKHEVKTIYLEEEQEERLKKEELRKQEELSNDVLDKWHDKKKKDIQENPNEFYTED